jgi:membrane-bound ClpP family serine protease
MNWTIIVLLLLAGLILLLLEILVVPGTTVVGILGFALVSFGIYETYTVYGSLAGHLTLGLTILISVVAMYFSLKSRTWKKAMLHDKITGKVNELDVDIKPGDIGKSISRLAPSGKAEFDGKYMEVHSMGDFIDHQQAIVIAKIEDNKIFVKLKNT